MQNVKVIINAIAIPLSSIATILIISKNRRNIANILIGLAAFLGGVLGTTFELLKEIYFYIDINIAELFAKLAYLSIAMMTIPTLSFSIFFWRAKYKKIPQFLHFLVGIPAISSAIWLFIDLDVVTLVEVNLGINNIIKTSFSIFSGAILFLVYVLFVIELSMMALRVKSFPKLKRRMDFISVGFAVGLLFAFLSIFIFPALFPNTMQLTSLFVIITSVSVLLALSGSLSRGEKQLWHGCPKLRTEKDGTTMCMNTEDGVPIAVKVLDLGAIIERVQIDAKILKTGEGNCANTIFANDNGTVKCITTHKPIKVIGEVVKVEEIELAHTMEIMNGHELCADCLHKIIAYRKEHHDKTDAEIKQLFLGIRAEEFFGVS
jgi:hypothetical protein